MSGNHTLILEPDGPVAPGVCRLCSKQFPAPVRLYTRDGKSLTHQAKQFGQAVSLHMVQAHAEIVQENVAWIQSLDSFLVMSRFQLPGDLTRLTDIQRHQIHRRTRIMRITDQKLTEKVMGLALLNPAEQTRVLEMFTEMRDLYEEAGLHPDVDEAARQTGVDPGRAS